MDMLACGPSLAERVCCAHRCVAELMASRFENTARGIVVDVNDSTGEWLRVAASMGLFDDRQGEGEAPTL